VLSYRSQMSTASAINGLATWNKLHRSARLEGCCTELKTRMMSLRWGFQYIWYYGTQYGTTASLYIRQHESSSATAFAGKQSLEVFAEEVKSRDKRGYLLESSKRNDMDTTGSTSLCDVH
jgi:hypothetical protein